jgi:hypothetical protein
MSAPVAHARYSLGLFRQAWRSGRCRCAHAAPSARGRARHERAQATPGGTPGGETGRRAGRVLRAFTRRHADPAGASSPPGRRLRAG